MIEEAKNNKTPQITQPPPTSPGTVQVMHSSIMYDYIQADEHVRNAIKQFVRDKIMRVRDLTNNNIVMTEKSMKLGNPDRGHLYRHKQIEDFGHYHIKTDDARRGDISLIYKQELDNRTKSVVLKLATLIDHDTLATRQKADAVASKVAKSTYVSGPLPESRYPLFSWIKRLV